MTTRSLLGGAALAALTALGCHQADADLQKLIDAGRGDVPLTRLKFRCSNCGGDSTGWGVTSRGATAVQPWRS